MKVLFKTFTLLATTSNKVINTLGTLSSNEMIITNLARYAVKGLSPDNLSTISLSSHDKTFPDDRRFALLKKSKNENSLDEEGNENKADHSSKFNEKDPQWLHKENFLCTFSDPEFMADFQTSYEIVKGDGAYVNQGTATATQRLLTVIRRDAKDEESGSVFDLNSSKGREEVAHFFEEQHPPSLVDKHEQTSLVCVTQSQSHNHMHQFGNTSSGIKKNGGDTRTIHIVNEATVRDVENKINSDAGRCTNIKLNSMRFRPNIVVDGLEPWKEFDFVGKRLKIIPKQSTPINNGSITLKVLSKTVRCAGIGVDPTQKTDKLDVPQLLSRHFPQYGPYLGVYAVIECHSDADDGLADFCIGVGDRIELIDE